MRYVVPQFIEVEDKIIGPITVRQFVILMATTLIMALLYRLFDFALFLTTGIPVFALGVTFAFFRVNGQPFHFFLLNIIQTMRRPALRVWDKEPTDVELREIIRLLPPEAPPKRIRKEAMVATKLTELSLVVNTGGVYNPED